MPAEASSRFPRERTDGTLTTSVAIPEGSIFRLDPKLDIPSLHLPRLVAIMAEAAQRYGIIVRDKTLHAIGFYAEDPTPAGDKSLHSPVRRKDSGRSARKLPLEIPASGAVELEKRSRLRCVLLRFSQMVVPTGPLACP